MPKSAWLPILLAGTGVIAFAGDKMVLRTLPLAADGRLVIETEKGSIRVSGWDNPEVEIRARIEDQSYFLRDTEALSRTDVRIDAAPGLVRLKSDYSLLRERGWGVFGLFALALESPAVHYTIRMPRTARLRIKDQRSETGISGLKAEVEIETFRGSVECRELEGAIQFRSHRGSARFSLSRLAGHSRFETYRGDITVSLPRQSGFELDSSLGRNAGLESDFEVPHRIESRFVKSYRGAVNGGGPRLLVKSERGRVRLRRT